MAYEGYQVLHSVVASVDLSNQTYGTGAIYKPIALDDGDFANNGLEAFGIITKGGKATEHTTVAIFGISKFVAGAAVSAGARLTVVASGYMTTAGSGDFIVGRVVENSVASGAIGTGFFDFAQPVPFQDNSGSLQQEVAFTAVDCTLQTAAVLGSAIDVVAGTISVPANANAVLMAVVLSGATGRGLPVGMTYIRAGGVVTNGRMVTVAPTSGFWVNADSGKYAFGRAYAASAAGNSGGTFLAAVNMANPHYITSCLDLLV